MIRDEFSKMRNIFFIADIIKSLHTAPTKDFNIEWVPKLFNMQKTEDHNEPLYITGKMSEMMKQNDTSILLTYIRAGTMMI